MSLLRRALSNQGQTRLRELAMKPALSGIFGGSEEWSSTRSRQSSHSIQESQQEHDAYLII